MKISWSRLIFLIFLLLAAASHEARAQSYSIDWYTIDGGGGTSTNAPYTLSGTIGQPDASGPMTNGPYTLTGGFWTVIAVQTPGGPLLQIRLTTTNSVRVSWPSPSAGFILQQNLSVANTNWANFIGSTNDDGTNKSVTITPPTGNLYFRLKK
jgi:hypothetical protein